MADRAETDVARLIYSFRDKRVMLDNDLAGLYAVSTKALNQAVKRNYSRFPEEFVFQLCDEEISHLNSLRSQFVTLKAGRGRHRKYRPYAFTEQGVAMLSSVLRSPRAVEVNIEIMRAFVRLRQLLASHADLARKLDELESEIRIALGLGPFRAIEPLAAPVAEEIFYDPIFE